jgi:hypothetical protein
MRERRIFAENHVFARKNNYSHEPRLELKFPPSSSLNYFENLLSVRIELQIITIQDEKASGECVVQFEKGQFWHK